jgi:hypothetical protein
MGCFARACGCLALFTCMGLQAQTSVTTQSNSASANFAYLSDDDCVQNDLEVFASKTTVGAANAPKTTTAVTYSRHRYNLCEDTDLGTDVGAAGRTAFSGDLNRASLSATVSGSSGPGSSVTVAFVLEWAGRGDSARLPAMAQSKRAGRPTVVRSENLSRTAAVRGTIDGLDVSGGAVSASLHTTESTISR